jgi:hypothetical protein
MSDDELLSRRGKIMKVDHAELRSYHENAVFFEECQSFAITRLTNRVTRFNQHHKIGLVDNLDVRITWRSILKGLFNR